MKLKNECLAIKNEVRVLLLSFLIAFAFFNMIIIQENIIIIVCIVTALIGILSFDITNKQNRNLIIRILLIYSGVIEAFGVQQNSIYLLLFGILLIVATIWWLLHSSNNIKTKQYKNDLFLERERDLKQIRDYLLNRNILIIGIDASWGNGKTYLIEELKRRCMNKKYIGKTEIVTVDILATNLDNVLEYLVGELDDVLYNNGILSRYSRKLGKFFSSNKNLEFMYSLFNDAHSSYAKTLCGFKQELVNIDKNIFIIIEDLDRIQDKDLIMKLLYISEKLSSEKTKIIYQYDSNKLKGIISDSSYIEKYIPYQIKLTNISFKTMVKYLLKKWAIPQEVLDIKDLYRLPPYLYLDKDILLDREFVEKECRDFFKDKYRLRCIEHFVTEINANSDFYNTGNGTKNDDKNLLVSFYFIKHFMPDIFLD